MSFKSQTYKKIEWLKNKSKDGGAMNEVIAKSKPEEMIVHIESKKLGRLWTAIEPDNIFKLLEKNINLYEVLATYPQKIHFDVDINENLQSNDLDLIKKIIYDHIPDAELSISGSETETKHSYHIIVNNYVLNNEQEKLNFKMFVKNTLYPIHNGFDWKIYTNNRNMKMINQSKKDCVRVQTIIEDENIKNHIITSFFKDNCKTFESFEIVKKTDNSTTVVYSDLPKVECDQNNLIDGDLENAKYLLSICPIGKNFNHKYTWKICRFCVTNNISFDEFWDWRSAKGNSETERMKWKEHFFKISSEPERHPRVTILQLKYCLLKYYPNILKDSEINKFNIMCDTEKEETIFVNRLEPNIFDNLNKNKCLVLNVGMGGGKTTQTVDYLEKMIYEEKTVCWMSPNIALTDNTFQRMKNFKSFNIYNSEKKSKKKAELIETSENIMICMNSLHYIKKDYNILVIDEIEVFLKKWCFNETFKKSIDQHTKCYNKFISLLKNAEHIILLDAFITNLTLDFLKDLDIKFTLVKRNNDLSYNPREAIEVSKKDKFDNLIINDIKNDKKLLIYYPYKSGSSKNCSMEDYCKTIMKYTGKKGIIHNADTDDKVKNKLKNVNEQWIKYDFVISNNVITVGLNFDVKYFDRCYCLIADFNAPRDIIQFSYRARTLNDNKLYYCHLQRMKTKDKIDDTDIKTKEYINLRKNICIEDFLDNKQSFTIFLYLAGYTIKKEEGIDKLITNNINYICESEDKYLFESIEDIDPFILKDVENEFYSPNCKFDTKLILMKHHFKKKFKQDTKQEILKTIWDSKYVKYVNKTVDLLYGNNKLMDLLKNEYNWTLYFPDNCDHIKDINFTKEIIESVMNSGLCSKFLNVDTSKHHLILKSYINSYFDYDVIKSIKKGKKNEVSYAISEEFKNIFIMIKDNVMIKTPSTDDAEFID